MSCPSSEEELDQLPAASSARKYRSKQHQEKANLLVHPSSPASCHNYRRSPHHPRHRAGRLFSLLNCERGEEKRRVGSNSCAQCVATFLCGVCLGLVLYLLFLLIFIKIYLNGGEDVEIHQQHNSRHPKKMLTSTASPIVTTSTVEPRSSTETWTTTMKTLTTITEKAISTSTTPSSIVTATSAVQTTTTISDAARRSVNTSTTIPPTTTTKSIKS
uniref:CLLAC-motif containing domain-containing protein n=1 Tax=Ditylenchus dipsaci TaxID=166011 RepID=A0A915ERD6_9BILA